jgi:hypothetical protein
VGSHRIDRRSGGSCGAGVGGTITKKMTPPIRVGPVAARRQSGQILVIQGGPFLFQPTGSVAGSP